MSARKAAPLHLLLATGFQTREGAALDGPMSSEELQQGSGEAIGTAEQKGPRWVGPPTRESEGRVYFAAFEAAGQQFNLGAWCACWGAVVVCC